MPHCSTFSPWFLFQTVCFNKGSTNSTLKLRSATTKRTRGALMPRDLRVFVETSSSRNHVQGNKRGSQSVCKENLGREYFFSLFRCQLASVKQSKWNSLRPPPDLAEAATMLGQLNAVVHAVNALGTMPPKAWAQALKLSTGSAMLLTFLDMWFNTSLSKTDMSLLVSPQNSYVEILTPGTSAHDCTWRQSR